MIATVALAAIVMLFQDSFLSWPVPRTMYAVRSVSPIVIDGMPDEPAWGVADWSDPFVDITGRADLQPIYETRTAVVWNDTALFIGARLEEPHVWGTLRERDTVIFYDNDFELFFDPDGDNHRYGEIEINALNTVWDLLLEKPYRDGGPAVNGWDLPGMQHAVAVDGSLNDPSDRDRGWTLEICIPWREIADLSDAEFPPAEGTQWRVNFSRVQWKTKDSSGVYVKTSRKEDNWVWSPMGIVNMHIPERWGVLEFRAGAGTERAAPDTAYEGLRRSVMEGYHAQKKFRKTHGAWARDMKQLRSVLGQDLDKRLRLDTRGEGFTIALRGSVQDGKKVRVSVTQDGRLRTEPVTD